MLNVWRVRREDLHMPVIPQLVIHRSHVFLPTFAVNPEKPLLPLRKALSCSHASPSLESSHLFSVLALPSSAHSGPTTGNLRFTEFFAASIMTSLWKSLLPKLAAFWRETVQKAPAFSQLPRSPKPNHTLPSSENVKISRQAGEGTGDEDRSKEVSSFT